MMETIAQGAVPGFQWLCTGCTHGLPTMKNMTRTLNEIKQSNEVRMNAIEKKLDQVCETIEARITKRFDEEMPGILNQVGSKVETTMAAKLEELEEKVQRNLEKKMKTINKDINESNRNRKHL